jgi:hypothetical protein
MSRGDATAGIDEFGDISAHVADACNSVGKKQVQYAAVAVGVRVHVPKARQQEFPAPINYLVSLPLGRTALIRSPAMKTVMSDWIDPARTSMIAI